MHTKILIYTLISIILTSLIGGCAGAPAASSTNVTVAPVAEQPAYWPDTE